MAERNSILHIKLQELESSLNEEEGECEDDVLQKFVFLRNFLSAEISSSLPSKRHDLDYVADRIDELEAAFRKRKFLPPPSYSDQHSDDDDGCSCTDSCFNDGGEDRQGVLDFAETEECQEAEGFNGEKEEKAMVKWEGDEEEEETQKLGSLLVYKDAEDDFLEGFGSFVHGGLVIRERKEEEVGKDLAFPNNSYAIGHICGAMACGVMVGMILMGFTMVKLSGCFHFVDAPCCYTIPT